MFGIFPDFRGAGVPSQEDAAGPARPEEEPVSARELGKPKQEKEPARPWPIDSRPTVIFVHYRDAVAFEKLLRPAPRDMEGSSDSEDDGRAEMEKLWAEVDHEVGRVRKALKQISPFGNAIEQGRLGIYGQIGWVRLATEQRPVPYTGADALHVLRHGWLQGGNKPLLREGTQLPLQGRSLVSWYSKAPSEDSDSEEPLWETAKHTLPRENVLVVAIRPAVLRDDDVAFIDGRQEGPWPYFLETGASMSPKRVALMTARCLGKLLGLGEESSDPGQLSAPDTWLRPLPNVWATTAPDQETAPWKVYWGPDDKAPRTQSGHGTSGAVVRGKTTLHLMVPDEPCLLKKPLGSRKLLKAGKGAFCRVCRAHLGAVFGEAVKPLPIPVFTWKDGGFGPADVTPWATAEEKDSHAQRLWDAVKVQTVGAPDWTVVTRPASWSPTAEEPTDDEPRLKEPDGATWTLTMVAEGRPERDDQEPTVTCSLTAQSILSPGGRTVLLTFDVAAPTEGTQVVRWEFVRPIWGTTSSGPDDALVTRSYPVAAKAKGLDTIASNLALGAPGEADRIQPGEIDAAVGVLLDGSIERLHTGADSDRGLRGLASVSPSTDPDATSSSGLLFGHRALQFPASGMYASRPEGLSASLGALLSRVLLQLDRNSLHAADDSGLLESQRHLLFGYVNGLGTPGLPAIPSDLAVQPDPTSDGSVQVTLRDGQSKARFHAVWSYPGWDYATERLAEVIGREKGTYLTESDFKRPLSERSLFDPPLFTHMPGCGFPPQQLADDPPEEEPVG